MTNSADNGCMEIDNTFSGQIVKAVTDRSQWYDNHEMDNIIEQYRVLHTCVRSLFEALVKKSVIQNDPYKLDKKISDVTPMDDEPFGDNERNLKIGMRFSDYETMLDYICNYYKFSISHMTISEIKKLVATTNSFQWTSFNVNNQKVNTRGLATLIFDLRQNTDPMTASMITDSLSKASKAVTNIMNMLKALTEFQREVYKASIRREVFAHPAFKAENAQDAASELKQIKSLFTQVMGKTPFYNDLIDEIISEDHAPNKAALQKELLSKMQITASTSEKKEKKVDTKELILEAVKVLGGIPGQLESALSKINDNHDVLASEKNTFKDKIVRLLKKTFGVKEKDVVYSIVIVDAINDVSKRENIHFESFKTEVENRIRRFAAVSTKGTPAFGKLSGMTEDKILEFLSQQISEANHLVAQLNAFDEYFKTNCAQSNKSKIKGLKMEVTAIKNTVAKTNQRRAEYVAFIEEQAQMKKLGISDS